MHLITDCFLSLDQYVSKAAVSFWRLNFSSNQFLLYIDTSQGNVIVSQRFLVALSPGSVSFINVKYLLLSEYFLPQVLLSAINHQQTNFILVICIAYVIVLLFSSLPYILFNVCLLCILSIWIFFSLGLSLFFSFNGDLIIDALVTWAWSGHFIWCFLFIILEIPPGLDFEVTHCFCPCGSCPNDLTGCSLYFLHRVQLLTVHILTQYPLELLFPFVVSQYFSFTASSVVVLNLILQFIVLLATGRLSLIPASPHSCPSAGLPLGIVPGPGPLRVPSP